MTPTPIFTRRSLLVSAATIACMPNLSVARDDADDREITAVRDKAKAAGLGELGVSRNEQYLAIGDAPEGFRGRALEILVGLAKDYLKHLKDKEFRVEKPSGRMTVVALSGRAAFEAFEGGNPGPIVGGYYDVATNRLVMFDNRDTTGDPNAERRNTVVLFHEATHQLTFNTGLLDREGDIPLAIAEGIANYGEARTPNGRTPFGAVNRDRLDGLTQPGAKKRLRVVLRPVADWIKNDDALDDRLQPDRSLQIGYSECWLLVHYLMKTPSRLPGFRAYLEAIRARKDASKRMDDWTAHLGDPAKFDKDLAAYLRKLT
ncbi:MAG: hypothetical protein JWN86_1536 [Planctomycetota bacterium]|nr:hypothetical protein [Planctomycetota bacterium]